MGCTRRVRHLLLLMAATTVAGQASLLWAQKAPGAGYVFPAGGKAGTTVEVKLGGYDWTPDTQFLLHNSAIKLEVTSPPSEVISHLPPYWFGIKSMVNDPPLPREVSARFILPADLPEGPIRWCVANASGGSPCGVLIVGQGEELVEDEQRTTPQPLKHLPVTVSGRLMRIEEVDHYQFQLERSGLVTCELIARRLGSDLFGVLEIRDSSGKKIAETFDTEGQDPVLTFFSNESETYTVAVRDLDYRGYRSSTYRLAVKTGPRIMATIPSAGRRGETRSVEFIGTGVSTGRAQLESIVREVTFPSDVNQSRFSYQWETPSGHVAVCTLALSDLPELVEPDSLALEARRLTVPTAMTGRLQTPDRKDRYTISGVKGDLWNLSAEGRCSGSSLDLALTVLGLDGKEIASNDDAPGTTDSRLSITLPADGDYQVVISDVSGTADDICSVYRLVVEKPISRFRLRTPGIVNLPIAGGTGSLEGTVIREGGFNQPIKLTVSGLPTGITAPAEVVIEPAAPAFKIPLTIDSMAPAGSSFVQIQGTALDGVRELIATAQAPATGSLVVRDPELNLVPMILMTTTLKPPFKIKPTEADGGRRVHRGATHLAELIVERDPGFTGEIVLDMSAAQSRHRQGIHGPQFVIAPSLRTVEYPVFVPECLETARTSRIGLVAMTKVRDPQGTERTVIAAVEGQITMSIEGALLKLSQTSDELIVPVGQSFVVPLKLARSRTLSGTVTVELLVSKEQLGLVEADPLTLSLDRESSDWTVATKSDPRLVGNRILTARATAMRDGHPVISECQIPVSFVVSAATATIP